MKAADAQLRRAVVVLLMAWVLLVSLFAPSDPPMPMVATAAYATTCPPPPTANVVIKITDSDGNMRSVFCTGEVVNLEALLQCTVVKPADSWFNWTSPTNASGTPLQTITFIPRVPTPAGQSNWGICTVTGIARFLANPPCSTLTNLPFKATGTNWFIIVVVDLAIFNGQGGAQVPDGNEETVGAFTVANLNDSNGNGTIDKDDANVTGEVDLMKIVLRKPTFDLGGMVTLSVTAGGAKIKVWESATKGTAVNLPAQFNVSDLPKTLWVEGIAKSGALRDIELVLDYKGCKDHVKTTLIWAEKNDFKNKLTDALWGNAGNPLKNTFSQIYGGKFGKQLANPPVNVQYAMGMEFTVFPNGIGAEPGVKFDVTRQIEFHDWIIDKTSVSDLGSETFPAGDKANDDKGQSDEDNSPQNNHVYSIDGPGIGIKAQYDEFISRNNFKEYVRVRLDGAQPAGDTLDGSRCSDKAPWHARFGLTKGADGKWQENPARPNDVDQTHIIIGNAP